MTLVLITPDMHQACPSPACFPGDFPAVLPYTVTPVGDGSLRAEYRHGECGTEWFACWDTETAGWPLSAPRRAA